MDVIPWRTQIYLGLVASAALFAAAFAVSDSGRPDTAQVVLAAGLGLAMLAAWMRPVPLSFKTHFYLDTVVVVAAILILEPGPAIVALGSGTLIAQVFSRRLWDESLFNTAQAMLQVAVGSWLLTSAGWDPTSPQYGDPRLVIAIIISGFAVLLANQILVGGIVSLQAAMNPFDVWTSSMLVSSRAEILGHVAQVGLGIVAAHLALTHPWMLVLLAFPISALYSAATQSFEFRRRAEEAHRLGENALAEAQRVAAIGSWEWNLIHGGHVWSDEVVRMLGHQPDEVQPGYERLIEAIHPDDRNEVDDEIHRALQTGGTFNLEHRVIVNGDEHIVHHRGEVVQDDRGRKTRLIATLHDISERKELESRLHYLAYHDPLTGLANRAHFMEQLEEAVRSSDHDSPLTGLLFIDLDNFKHTNDRFGHDQGDILLSALANRLGDSVRGADVVARLGGDEFTILVPDVPSVQALEQFAERLLNILNEPVILDGRSFAVTASIGICAANPDDVTPVEFLRRADVALYQAKRSRCNTYQVYNPRFPGPPDPGSYRELAATKRSSSPADK